MTCDDNGDGQRPTMMVVANGDGRDDSGLGTEAMNDSGVGTEAMNGDSNLRW